MKTKKTAAFCLLLCCVCLATKLKLDLRLASVGRTVAPLRPLQATYHGHSLKRYSLGFDNFIAGLIWIGLLQHADYCKLTEGNVSWEYAQLDAVTTLDPNFDQAYPFSAIFLSVFRQDKLGAKLMLEKWVKRAPNFWRANYMLGYHLYYEMNDYAAASKYILRAASMNRAPNWLSSLGVRLLSQTGALMQSLNLAIELYGEMSHPEGKVRLLRRIRALNYHTQRSAWERALDEYRRTTGHPPPSSVALHPFVLGEVRSLASMVNREEAPHEVQTALGEKFGFHYDATTQSIAALHGNELAGELGIYKH